MWECLGLISHVSISRGPRLLRGRPLSLSETLRRNKFVFSVGIGTPNIFDSFSKKRSFESLLKTVRRSSFLMRRLPPTLIQGRVLRQIPPVIVLTERRRTSATS